MTFFYFFFVLTLMSEYISASTRGVREEKSNGNCVCMCVNACADEAEAKKSVQERNNKKHVFHDDEK